jgi:hypothetical protein
LEDAGPSTKTRREAARPAPRRGHPNRNLSRGRPTAAPVMAGAPGRSAAARQRKRRLIYTGSGRNLTAITSWTAYDSRLPPTAIATITAGAPRKRRPGGEIWPRGSRRGLRGQTGGPGAPPGVPGDPSPYRQGRRRGNRPRMGAWGEPRSGHGPGNPGGAAVLIEIE